MLYVRFFLAISCLFSLPAFAIDADIRGFATIGAVKHDSQDLRFRRDISFEAEESNNWSFTQDTTIGIQVDKKLSDQWNISGQAVYKKRLENSLNRSIEWAYLHYNPGAGSPYSIRFGRIGTDVFMLSDYRNVGYAYPWVRPPMEFYGQLAFYHIDGGEIRYSTFLDDTFFQARLAAGVTENNFIEKEILFQVSPIITASLLWEKENWRFHLGSALVRLDSSPSIYDPLIYQLNIIEPLWPEAAEIKNRLDLQGKEFHYYSAGISYDSSDWFFQTELNFVGTQNNIITPSKSAYISLGYRFSDLLIYSLAAFTDNTEQIYQVPDTPPALLPVQALIQDSFNQTGLNQKSLSIGARWDISSNIALKAQWDRAWVKPHGSGLWAIDTTINKKEQVDIISINLNYLF